MQSEFLVLHMNHFLPKMKKAIQHAGLATFKGGGIRIFLSIVTLQDKSYKFLISLYLKRGLKFESFNKSII